MSLVEPLAEAVHAGDRFDGRAYALAISSQRLLAAIGVWPAVAARSQPILAIRIGDGRAGDGPSPLTLEFDHAEIEEGPMGFMVEDRHLRPALLAAVAGGGGHRPDLPGQTVTGQAADPAGMTLTASRTAAPVAPRCWSAATAAPRPPPPAPASAAAAGTMPRPPWSARSPRTPA